MGLRFASKKKKKGKKLLLQSSIKLPETKQWGLLQAGINFPKHRNQPILRTQKVSYLAQRVCAAGQSGDGREGRQTEELLKNNPILF